MAQVHGVNPHVIITDHVNHERAIQAMNNGDYKVVHPMTPNVDLWRLVVRAIHNRGGLRADGEDLLWVEWQPAHTRASTNETAEQRNRRRDNAAADLVANNDQ